MVRLPIAAAISQGAMVRLPIAAARFPKFVPIKIRIAKPYYFLKEPAEIIDDVHLESGLMKVRNTIQEMLDAG